MCHVLINAKVTDYVTVLCSILLAKKYLDTFSLFQTDFGQNSGLVLGRIFCWFPLCLRIFLNSLTVLPSCT